MVFLAQAGPRLALQQMQPENFNFLCATEVAPFALTHITVPFFAASVRKFHPDSGVFN